MGNSTVLLLTSTISPQDFNFVGRKGVHNREDDYFSAVSFYCKFNLPIVFIDNSNYRSDRIEKIIFNNSESEYLLFESKQSFKGKGHGELEILKYGLENSNILNKYQNIIKISGRLTISNFFEFYSKLDLNLSIHYCNYSREFSWVDTRIMILNKSFIKNYLFPTMDKFLNESENVFFEKAYARSIHLYQYDGGRISLWPAYPLYNGFNGESGKKIKFSLIKKFKYYLFNKIKIFVFSQTI
ncbi:hypothetical protein FHS59_003459 [Algoriphagus iocasae]|uniref:Uncharacterized protein n=1 Tax=Algoriphagus iocasae TaxID=1836499 RepID=A0A841MUP5_9BACT|nr:hypothetical protein [Algoriphagus iocasae]MBB6327816.1 hypothetical protein [Algoriphagus iocasae]